MSRLTFYVPDELADLIRSRARDQQCSVSAYITEIIRRELLPPSDAWSRSFLELYGSAAGEFAGPADPPPEPVDEL